jgi:DNA repair and recombination protein RAD52
MTPEQVAMLNAPLDPKHVKEPSGSFGPKGDYLEGWHVIMELNRVFGFDGWSYTISLNQDALTEGEDGRGNPQWQAAYTCICTLTVGQTVRQDVGFGSGFAKAIGDAIEGATKEAATDALKRCARTFGNIFGLALYDKSRANVQAAPSPLIDDAQRAELMTLASQAQVDVAAFCKAFKIVSLADLPSEKFATVRDRWTKRLMQISQKEAA